MAKGFKTGGRNFEPGNEGGPGQPMIPQVIKDAMRMNRAEFVSIANRYLNMTKKELKDAVENPSTPMKEMMVGAVIHQAVLKGDPVRYEFLLDRLIGKVPTLTDVQISHSVEVPKAFLDLNDRDLLLKAKAEIEEALARLPQQLPP